MMVPVLLVVLVVAAGGFGLVIARPIGAAGAIAVAAGVVSLISRLLKRPKRQL